MEATGVESDNKGKDEMVKENGDKCDAQQCALEKTSDDKSIPKTEEVSFTVVYNKNKHDITFSPDKTIKQLKMHLESIISVPYSLQKVMLKGLAKDDSTLKDLDVKNGTRFMVVGSKLNEIMALSSVTEESVAKEEKVNKEPLCRQKMHKKIIDKGVPDDLPVGIANSKDPLPQYPLSGLVNKYGGKVRLTFRLELDQLWIGTKERTEKITMSSVKHVINEAIDGHPEYHIMGLQLGPTEASRYWLYWVPAQYVDAIKSAILGSWAL